MTQLNFNEKFRRFEVGRSEVSAWSLSWKLPHSAKHWLDISLDPSTSLLDRRSKLHRHKERANKRTECNNEREWKFYLFVSRGAASSLGHDNARLYRHRETFRVQFPVILPRNERRTPRLKILSRSPRHANTHLAPLSPAGHRKREGNETRCLLPPWPVSPAKPLWIFASRRRKRAALIHFDRARDGVETAVSTQTA